MDHIKSSQNPTFKMLKSLASSKGIKKEQKCLVHGKRLVSEVQALHKDSKLIHFDESFSPDILIDKSLFTQLNPLPNNHPLLLIKTPQISPSKLETPAKGIEVLLPVGDPKNLGALIRTSLAFGVSKIILLSESAHPFLPDCIKASSGAVFQAPLELGPSIKNLTPSQEIFTLDKNGTNIKESGLHNKSFRLLIGEEGGRLSQELKTKSLSIPMTDQVESLNVNSCLSVALYELCSSQK